MPGKKKAHPSCMEYSDDLARRARNSPWQCIDCKTCYICTDAGDPDMMLFCDACDKGYHMNCHNPPVEEKPTGKWECKKCVLELGLPDENAMDTGEAHNADRGAGTSHSNTDGDGASLLPTPSESPVHFTDHHHHQPHHHRVEPHRVEPHRPSEPPKENGFLAVVKMNGNSSSYPSLPRLADTLTADVPDASDWTIDDVVTYFRNMGFIDQCEVFREQEIDGKSLLLMKRSDVLTGLSLKLGPALKIFTHIQRLQTRGQMMNFH